MNSDQPGKRAAIYLRVSTSSKSRYGEATSFDQRPELQEAPLQRLAEQRGWTVTRVYCDRISGAKEIRPALAELMAYARRGQFDVLMVWRFDRLSRSVKHFLGVVDELRQVRVDLVSQEQSLDTTTAMGSFTLTMFAALAELERGVIRDRVLAGMEHARIAGTKSGRAIGRPMKIFSRPRAQALREQGLSFRKIALTIGVGEGTVRRLFQQTGAALPVRQNPAASAS